MAKRKSGPKKPRSARAEQRAALQKLYAPATYSGLRDLLDMGKLDLRELRKYYTDARSKAVKRVQRIEKSEVPFADEPPIFEKTSELSDEDLLKAVGRVNKFLRGPTTVPERKAAYQELLEDLHEKGLTFLEMKDLRDWDRFRTWLRAKGLTKISPSSDARVADIFISGKEKEQQNSQYWQSQYEELKRLLVGRTRRGAGKERNPTDRLSQGKPRVSLNRSRRRK